MSNDPVTNNDQAPWFIKEIRVYGISGLVALATVLGIKVVYDNSRLDMKEKDAIIARQFDKASDVTERNTKVISDFNVTLQKNTEAIDGLNNRLRKESNP